MIRCLVRRFGDNPDSVPPLSSLKEWVYARWTLRGGVLRISKLGGPFVLFKFENKCEVDVVLLRGSRWFKGREVHLQRWGPEVGCYWNGSHAKEVWVRVVQFPLHFWGREVFKRIRDSYGGFMAIDEEIAAFSQLQ